MMSSHLIWGDIGKEYLTRYVNEYLGIVYFDQPDTLTKGVRDPRETRSGSDWRPGPSSTSSSDTSDMPARLLLQGGQVLAKRAMGGEGLETQAAC